MLNPYRYQEAATASPALPRFRSILSQRRSMPATVSIITTSAPQRRRVENFISEVYQQTYGADIHVSYPVLISASDHHGNLMAAAGFRAAEQEPLFLEQYLERPVEEELEAPRSNVAEIGNLASTGTGATIYLFAALACHLHTLDFTHAVLTSTRSLERILRQAGLQTRRHRPADPACLDSKSKENWGRYYETRPHVLSCPVGEGFQQLQRWLDAYRCQSAKTYYSRLHYKAREEV